MNWPDEFSIIMFQAIFPAAIVRSDSLHESLITFNDLPGSKVV